MNKLNRGGALFAALSTILIAAPATATEGGGNSYAMGVETVYAGTMLPEGAHVLTYYSNYEGTRSKDDSGNDNAKLAYFGIKVHSVAVRVSYVWPGVRWFGANVETRAAMPHPSIDLSLGVARPAALGPLDRSGANHGFGDLQLSPLLLGWHSRTIHQTAGIEGFIPVGEYKVSNVVNIGRNYAQLGPVYAVTYVARDSFLPDASQASLKLRYGVNWRNKDTDYKSGNEFTVEYSGDVRVTPALAVGINGYLYKQTSADVQHGAPVNGNGNRGEVKAIGPYVTYNFTPKFSVIAKVQLEYDARNKPEGHRFWLQAKLPI